MVDRKSCGTQTFSEDCSGRRDRKRSMIDQTERETAIADYRSARLLLHEARMVGAPTDCVAERERDLSAAAARLRVLSVDPDDLTIDGNDMLATDIQ